MANLLVEIGLLLAIVGQLGADRFLGEEAANFIGAVGVILILAVMFLV